MSSDIALRVEGLGKKYTIRHKDHDHVTLAQAALHRLRHPKGALGREDFWALKDVSFEVPRGEVLGVIGHNGAGKSTLLKLLSRITPPTTGRVEVFGRIGSLLEVGTGFHPELTGRENVYLNGSILGMKKREIDKQFDAIVDFSGVEQFLDTPVKRYSSGMYVRLAFAVAAHLETEILLLDEVLAVGDQEFQRKCLGRIGEVVGAGRAVILVSHSLETIRARSDRALLLRAGGVIEVGDPASVIDAYLRKDTESSSAQLPERRGGSGEFRVESIVVDRPTSSVTDPRTIRVTIERRFGGLDRYFVSVAIRDPLGESIIHCDSRLADVWFEHPADGPRSRTVVLELAGPWLRPARYSIEVYVCNAGVIDSVVGHASFDVCADFGHLTWVGDEAVAMARTIADFRYWEETSELQGHGAQDVRGMRSSSPL